MQRFLGDRLLASAWCSFAVRRPRLSVNATVNWMLCTAFEKVVPLGVLESPSQ